MKNYFNLKYNVEKKNYKILQNNKNFILKSKKIIQNLPALNIVKNRKYLKAIIKQTDLFKKNKNNFLVFGTGGSNLGARALVNIINGKKINIKFFDNIDPINFKNTIDKINLSNTGFIIVSKSGTTPETLSQLGSLIQIFDSKKKIKDFYMNTLVITEFNLNPLHKIAKSNNCYLMKHEDDIGGRYSVFSNVGIVPAILAGLNVNQIYDGALEEITNFNSDYLYLAKFFKNQKFKHKISNSIIMTYSDSLFYFGKWYLQLWAESLGKNNKGITAIHSIGTTDQHSQLQLYLDGPKDKFFTFITTQHSKKGFKIHNRTMKKYNINYLIDKTMGDLMQAEQKATIDTFIYNKLPLREIYINKINEYSMGKLMAFSIMETIATCIYYEVDPFNQPAVEIGKKLTKEYLS